MVEKIITYALGEHDPRSAQIWRTSNDFCSPDHGVDEDDIYMLVLMRLMMLMMIRLLYYPVLVRASRKWFSGGEQKLFLI